jgi:predicted TIM-barrel fold metal-dependent hydrolase
MTATAGTSRTAAGLRPEEVIISADSHVMEPHDLWEKHLTPTFGDQAPRFKKLEVGESFQHHPGGHDPHERIKEMTADGVSAEVLYPTLGLTLFGLDDARLQEACFQLYNDWLIEYCQAAPDRLVGVPTIATYDVDHAVKELERTKKAGLKGALLWQAPHPDLPIHSSHYDKFWAAAQDLDMPVSFHILTGHNYSKKREQENPIENYRGSVNWKLIEGVNALFDLVWYGVLHRFPNLKIVLVENEIGWAPFVLQQWDYYFRRFRTRRPVPIDQEPSAYFNRQVYITFFRDAVGSRCLEWWGAENGMWSNDFPHENSTWPHSREWIERELGYLPENVLAKLVRDNVTNLYHLRVPQPV